MAYEYEFYLNGTKINDEPRGWRESKRKIKRSDKYKGLFLEYVTDLTFHGDGYTFIQNAISSNDFCTEIIVQIFYRCSEFKNFTVYFTGVIKMDEIKVSEERCELTCNIEDNNLSGLIINREDTKVKLNAPRSISGTEVLAAINKSVRVHNSGTGSHAGGVTRTMYYISDVFQFILDYITDAQVNFTSDFFTLGTSTRASKTITFTNPTVDLVNTSPTANLVIIYKNGFNEQFTLTIPKQATVAATLNYAISQFNFNATGTSEAKYYVQDYRYVNNATTNGTSTITLIADVTGFEIISISNASVSTGSTGVFSTMTNKMRKMSLTSGNQLRDTNTLVPEISFNELFKEMDKLFDLGVSISTISGVITIRVEPLSYFLINTNVVTLNNVVDLKYTISKEFARDLISTGDGNDNTGVVGNQTGKIDWTISNICSATKLDLKTSYISDFNDFYTQLTLADDKNDEKIFILEAGDSGAVDADSIVYHNIIYSTTGAAKVDIYVINAKLTNYWKVYNWLVNIKGSPIFQTYRITNVIVPKLIKEYDFEYALTFAEQELLRTSGTQFISFNISSNAITQREGWIKEIEMENKTGKAKFKLLTT